MPKRSSNSRPPSDVNEAAARIVALVTDDGVRIPARGEKNPAAVALGRLGGRKGGRARADTLSPERRQEIARKAAAARWDHKLPEGGL